VGPVWSAGRMDLLFAIGVTLAICGNTLIASALTLQKFTHNLEQQTGKPASSSPLFWFSIAGMIGGEVGNFAAFGFASPTVVSPLGAVAVVVNGLLAALVLQEKLRLRNVIGMAFTILGSVVVVMNAPPTVEDLSAHAFIALVRAPSSLIYLSLLALVVLLLYLAEPKYGSKYVLINLMLCSTLGSVTVLCSSAISKFIGQILSGDLSLLTVPAVYLVPPTLGATAVLQLKFLNQAMVYFDSSLVVPTYYVTFTICSISGGGVVLQDFWRFTPAHALGFCAGCALCFAGVGLITTGGERERPMDKFRRSVHSARQASGVIASINELASNIGSRLSAAGDTNINVLGAREAEEGVSPALITPPGVATFVHASHRNLRLSFKDMRASSASDKGGAMLM